MQIEFARNKYVDEYARVSPYGFINSGCVYSRARSRECQCVLDEKSGVIRKLRVHSPRASARSGAALVNSRRRCGRRGTLANFLFAHSSAADLLFSLPEWRGGIGNLGAVVGSVLDRGFVGFFRSGLGWVGTASPLIDR